MRTSDTIGMLAGALAKARLAFTTVVKDKTATVKSAKADYSFDYADLASVMDAVVPGLAANGLAVVQAVEDAPVRVVKRDERDGGGEVAIIDLAVTTRLMHESGEWIESVLTMPYDPGKPQNKGSAATYARRYGLSGLLGVSSEEDDDGNAAEGNERTIAPRTRREPDDTQRRQQRERDEAKESVAAALKPDLNPQTRRRDLARRLQGLGLPQDKWAEVLGEWIGRPVGDRDLTSEDWKRADQKLMEKELEKEK